MHVKALLNFVELGAAGELSSELSAAIAALWADSGVQVGYWLLGCYMPWHVCCRGFL